MSYNDLINTTTIRPTYDFSVPNTMNQYMLDLYEAVLSGDTNTITQNLNNTPILVITNNIRYFSALLFLAVLRNRPEILDIFIEHIKNNSLGIEKFFDGTYGDLVCATVCANATECFLFLLFK